MRPSRQRLAYRAVREALLLILAFVGSWLFLNHHLLYLQEAAAPIDAPWEAYVLTALILYGLARAVGLVTAMRVPRIDGGTEVCPECGRAIEDATPETPARPSAPVRLTPIAVVASSLPRPRPSRARGPGAGDVLSHSLGASFPQRDSGE